jgi:hypothetical protein
LRKRRFVYLTRSQYGIEQPGVSQPRCAAMFSQTFAVQKQQRLSD